MQRPTHLVLPHKYGPAAERTLCGIGPNDPRRFPVVGLVHLPAHHRGYGLTACAVCADVWSRCLLVALSRGIDFTYPDD